MSDNETPKYRLKVTAGPSYDPSTHQLVPVNEDQTLRIENEHAITSLCVRIRDYTDQYSISFAIVFKQPVNANSLLFGNDFDRPIRDRLPPGFNAALRLVKWTIDPSLDGDAYADKPYLYGPAVASWNQFCIGEKIRKNDEVPGMHERVVEEGGEGSGLEVREQMGIPAGVNERRKYFQSEETRTGFEFEEGRAYWMADLVVVDFSLHLPGITINVLPYINEDNHSLRYVLKNRDTDEVYLVVLFTLVLQGTDEEPLHKEETERMRKESKEQHEKNNGKLGRFEWEPEPSADDVE
ncbi:unnamed protein product [Aspergillus oryzae]|uniref:Unnamed protein product n=2 Tax=Aspergillus oryzae TaxID=5062 RepID=A0AAN4YKD9_ASPOZ|nr:unnamed protein product [Aspergillus oryzae]GMF94946.1 unnamed protein product [Aspergillus oryzae]GMG14002.1 unnamed protein product [Aspergillus oryzae]GMG31817.1 unnamed protein product [Aspergillus oryzae]GMG51646.1 unnamed protein product [Aspergillus oryzae var. brunneus]